MIARYPERDGYFCLQHLMGEEAWKEVAKRGGRARVEQIRARKHGSSYSGLEPHIDLQTVYDVARAGLEATFDDAGLPGQIDWQTRLLSCLVVLNTFGVQERRTPEAARQLLEKALPANVRDDPESQHRLSVEAAYREARAAWDELRLRVDPSSPLPKLYREPYPRHLFPPWMTSEERTAIQRAQPQPEGKVKKIGRDYVLERDGDLPLLLPR